MNRNKASWLSVSAVLAMFGVAYSISSAQETPTPMEQRTTTVERSEPGSAANIRTLTLTVKDVDKDEHKVTFEAKVKPEANLMKNGQPIKLDQLEEGDVLRVSMDTSTGEVVKAQVTKTR
jgi:acetamidase/formamidase